MHHVTSFLFSQLSSEALTHSANQLAGQLVGRIHDYGTETVAMVTQAREMLESSQLDDATADVVRTLLNELSVLMSKMDKKQAVSQKF